MKDLAAIILNFLYDITQNTYLAVAMIAIVPLLLNSSLRRLSMRNLGLRKQIEPEIASIHEKYGYDNSKSQQKISEIISKYNYVVYASIFLSILQFVEGWAFMTGFKSTAIYPAMIEPDVLNMHMSIRQMWNADFSNWPYVLAIIFVAMLVQRINDAVIEKNLIGDQVLADCIILALITVGCLFLPAYIAVYWFVTEVIELVITLRSLKKPPQLHFTEKKNKNKK